MRRPGADSGIYLRAFVALVLMAVTAAMFVAFFALNFGFPVGALVLLVVIGAVSHFLSSQGQVLQRIGVDQPKRDDSLRIVAGELTPWVLPALFPFLAWLIWNRSSGWILGVAVYTGLILAVEAIFYGVRVSRQEQVKLSLTPITTGKEIDALERVCQQAGTRVPKLLLLASAAPEAFSLGLGPANGEIVITRGLLDTGLTPEELEAVLAHELCHLLHHDTSVLLATEGAGSWPGAFGSIFAVLAAVAGVITLFAFGNDGLTANVGGGIFFTGVFLFFAALGKGTWSVSFLVTRAMTRYREYSADRGSAVITNDPAQLAGALLKISQALDQSAPGDLRRLESANALMLCEATAHVRHRQLGRAKILLSYLLTWTNLFTSGHPPVKSRIERLQGMIE